MAVEEKGKERPVLSSFRFLVFCLPESGVLCWVSMLPEGVHPRFPCILYVSLAVVAMARTVSTHQVMHSRRQVDRTWRTATELCSNILEVFM